MPLHQHRFKIFYGWWVVIASALIGLYTGGVVFYGFTAVFEPIAQDMGYSYAQISLAASLRGMETGLLVPLVGILTDRWGPRRLTFAGAVVTGLGLIILGRSNSLGVFYAAFVLLAVGMSCCTLTTMMAAVASWFHKRVGIASGIVVSGIGLGGLLVPVIVRLIDAFGWRLSVTWLALGAFFIAAPLSLALRHKPEQYGYLPDGQARVTSVRPLADLSVLENAERKIKVRQLFGSRSFWYLVMSFTVHTTVVYAVITHVMPYLSSISIPRATSQWVAMIIPLGSISGRLGLGWLADHSDSRLVASGALFLTALGMIFFGYTSSSAVWLLVPFLILFCIGYGGSIVMRIAMVREYFGRTSFGTAFGMVLGFNAVLSMVGPPVAGWVYDTWGSYRSVWFILAALLIAAVAPMLLMSPSGNKGK